MTVNRAMLDTVFGSDNINTWADMNNNGNPAEMTTRIDWAIALALSMVQSKAKVAPYDWDDISADPQIEYWQCVKAGLLLYANRRVVNEQGVSINPYRKYEDDYDLFFRDLSGGRIALSASRTNRPYPAVVT